jgi:hypothetical protein
LRKSQHISPWSNIVWCKHSHRCGKSSLSKGKSSRNGHAFHIYSRFWISKFSTSKSWMTMT